MSKVLPKSDIKMCMKKNHSPFIKHFYVLIHCIKKDESLHLSLTLRKNL